MDIYISSGKGIGRTLISAFDNALMKTGVYNYNLIELSSIIPPNSKIILKRYKSNPSEYGDRLYIVKAEYRSTELGKFIGAGIGWYQLPDGSGVFTEHKKIGDSKKEVENFLKKDIRETLEDLITRRNFPLKKELLKSKTETMKVNQPSCIQVIAVFKTEAW